MGIAGCLGFGQCGGAKCVFLIGNTGLDQTIPQQGVGVCRRNRCASRKVISVDFLNQTGVIHHHLRGPKRGGRVACAMQQLLPHAAV